MTGTTSGLSRRRLFQILGVGAAGAAGVTSMAACSKAEPKGKGKGKGKGQGSGNGEFHGAYPYQMPPDGHLNRGGGPYVAMPMYIMEGPYSDLMHLPGGYYHWKSKEWEYFLAESSEFAEDGSTFTVKLRSGLTWSDGAKVSSQDYLTTLYVQRIQNSPVWASIEKLEAPDDTTLVVHLKSPSAVIDRYVLRSAVIDTKTYGSFADRAEKLVTGKGSEKEWEALNKEFQKFRPKEMIASGPFVIDMDSITDSQMSLVKNDKGYLADDVKFQKIVIYNGETPQVAPLVQNKSVDYATHGFTVAQEKAFVKVGYRILRPPNYSGPALFLNLDKFEEFKDVRVRRALAHAVNRADNGAVSLGESGKGVVYMAGFSDVQVPDWISDADQGKLQKYEFDQAKAGKLLEEAGWKKSGKTWQTPDGKPAEYTIKYPSEFADWSASGDNAAEQLSDFGIKVTPQGVDFEQFTVEVDTGKFEICIQAWGSSQHPHPHFAFVADLFTHNIPVAKNQGGRGIGFELEVETENAGKLDLEKVVTDAGNGLDEAEQKTNITKAALAFNELLPIVPLFERYGNNPVLEGERVKKFPEQSDPDVLNAAYADNFVILGLLGGTIEPV